MFELEYKDKLYTIDDNGEILISDLKDYDRTSDTTNGYYTSETNTIKINTYQAQIAILSENKEENKAEIKKLEKTIKREKNKLSYIKKGEQHPILV